MRQHRLAMQDSAVAHRSTRSRASGQTGNLPRALSSFVGRQEQVADLAQALSTTGLLTLVGIGGVGKTRLALATATAVRDNYAHGVWLVELAAVTDPTQVAAKVAAALGVRERPGSNPLETLTLVLRHRQLLLVLDNCEHVLDSSAELVTTLLQDCDNLTVLATSRELLGVPGEVSRTVLPLPVPGAEASFEQMAECDALQLFVERVRASDATFSLTPQNAALAGRICRRLDGLPLAIELAAARTKTMSLNEVAERLDDSLGLLTVGPRAAPRRHQTLRAAIDWSFDLLTEAERTLLSRLAIFSGGFSVDSVRQVCCDEECPPEADRRPARPPREPLAPHCGHPTRALALRHARNHSAVQPRASRAGRRSAHHSRTPPRLVSCPGRGRATGGVGRRTDGAARA